MPYLHCLSHNVKKAAERYGIRVVFSAPCKLRKVCPLLTGKKREWSCKKNHQVKFTNCVSNTIYEIPLSCGRSYIGQTGRCFNERAQEHNRSLRTGTGSNLALHCKRCDSENCLPHLNKTKFLSKAHSRTEREVVEAYFIAKRGDSCVSSPSLSLSREEINFLDGHINSLPCT